MKFIEDTSGTLLNTECIRLIECERSDSPIYTDTYDNCAIYVYVWHVYIELIGGSCQYEFAKFKGEDDGYNKAYGIMHKLAAWINRPEDTLYHRTVAKYDGDDDIEEVI